MKSARTVCKYPTRGPDGLMHVCELPLPCFKHKATAMKTDAADTGVTDALGNLAEPAGDPPPTAGDSTAPTDTPARTVVRWSEDAGTGFAPVDPLLRSPRQLLNGALEDFDAVLVNNPSREDLLTIKAMIRSAVRLMEHGVEFNDRGGK